MKKILFLLIPLLSFILIWPLLRNQEPAPAPLPQLSLPPEITSFPARAKVSFILDLGQKSIKPQTANRLINPVHAAGEVKIIAQIKSPNGQIDQNLPVAVEQQSPTTYELTVNPPPDFHPGRYQLVAEITQNNQQQTLQTDFSWGVLAINFDQDRYEIGQTANLSLAALDTGGHTLCQANLQLEIIDPKGHNTRLTNYNGINPSFDCGRDNVTDIPDYRSEFAPTTLGQYQVILTNLDTKLAVTDSFSVEKNPEFVIKRSGATRINPFKSSYTMNLAVTPKQDFKGLVTETLPLDFSAAGPTEWNVDWQAGKTYQLAYTYTAPKLSPAIFNLGPLTIGDYQETRSWILASDAPSLVVDSTNSSGDARGHQRRVIRTTYGANSNRTFVLAHSGSYLILYYSDDPETSSPTWNSVGNVSDLPSGDMVWDETNNVIYVAYGIGTQANSNAADIRYKLISNLGTTPTIGTERIALDGTAGGTTYNSPSVEIAGDSSTTKVFLFGNVATSGGNPTGFSVAVGTINSDNPTWGTYAAKTWSANATSGLLGVSRMNTDKLVVQYSDGADIFATRHDDSSDAEATSGWDGLDGTDNSQTTVSTDACGSAGQGSVVGMPASDVVWFSWFDPSADINTQSWSGSALGTEKVALTFAAGNVGTSLTTDGVTVWLVSRGVSDATQLIYKSRSASDGTSDWAATEYVLDDLAETVNTPLVSKKIYQGKLDVIYTTATNYYARHASSYKISGNIYQESAGSPYEGTTAWSGCDGSTLNVAVSVNGGTKQNTSCSASDGSYYFVLTQPTGSDQDITVFLDTGGGNKGALFTHNNDAITDITGLTLYKDKIMIRSESSSSITNADINTYDQTNDSDIPIASDGTNITVDSGYELHINSGETFAPGGNVTTPKIHIKGTYTGASETLTLNGSGNSSSCDATVATMAVFCLDGGTFTATSNEVVLAGGDSTTQAIVGSATFNNLSASTSSNAAGRTIQFTGSSTTTVSGTWTITGFSGKVITLQSSDTNAWTINPTAAAVTYVSVSRSTNTGTSFCATYSTDDGNNTSWNINAGASCAASANFSFEGVRLEGVKID